MTQRTDKQQLEFSEATAQPLPERSLWAAVIMQAITDIRSGGKSKGHGAVERSARHWIADNRPDIQNSFVSLCLMLDINPDRIREIVLK